MRSEEDFAKYVKRYFTYYLPKELGASKNTKDSYRDAIRLFIVFLSKKKFKQADQITFLEIDKDDILDYLDWVENVRNCCVKTRNQRLMALRSFFEYVSHRRPEFMELYLKVKSIKKKKAEKKLLEVLSEEDIDSILEDIDTTSRNEFRNFIIISFLYDLAIRVQELIDLTPSSLIVKKNNFLIVKVKGKGGKERNLVSCLPLRMVQEYLEQHDFLKPENLNEPLFTNHLGNKFTRAGVGYIVRKYTGELSIVKLRKRNVSPHWFRHARASHMVENNVDLSIVRDHLGHENLSTTSIYTKTSLSYQNKVIESRINEIVEPEKKKWQQPPNLIDWLKSIS